MAPRRPATAASMPRMLLVPKEGGTFPSYRPGDTCLASVATRSRPDAERPELGVSDKAHGTSGSALGPGDGARTPPGSSHSRRT